MKDRKNFASLILREQARLEKSARDTVLEGYSENWWGSFWSNSVADSVETLHQELVGAAESDDEWYASSYRLAGFLRSRLKLIDAIRVCECMEKRLPSKAAGPLSIRARILARQGKLDEAQTTAAAIEAIEGAEFFRVSKADLLNAARRPGPEPS